jgi:C4-dicarboxylate-specific signal transduction histidine kinase
MRISGRKSDDDRQPLDVQIVLRGAMELAEQQMRDTRVDMRLNCDPGLPMVRGNQVQFEQVVLNLLGNARDALAGRNQAEKWVRLSARAQADGQVEIMVEDNAGGVEASAIDHVFEPFFTTKPPGKGTGLGLSVSYGIIHEMNGTMTVENTDQGARFRIRLPIAESVPGS